MSILSLQCFYLPRCQKDSTAMHAMIMNISERLKVNQQVPCYYDPSEQQETILLTRLYDHNVVFHSLLWPSCMLIVGVLIIVMVKLTQYLSRLCEEIGKIKRWIMCSSCKSQACGSLVIDTWQKGIVLTKRPCCDFLQMFLFGWVICDSWLSLRIEDVTVTGKAMIGFCMVL